MRPLIWTPELTEFAIKHWRDGKSANMVASMMTAAFGTHFSRNAVIGRINRLGENRPAPSGPKPSRVAKLVQAKAARETAELKRKFKEQFTETVRVAKLPKPEPIPAVVADLSFARPWLERRPGQCAFPIGQRYYVLSCCAPIASGDNYCEAHRTIMGGKRQPWSPKDHRNVARA